MAPRRPSPRIGWCFTLNNPTEEEIPALSAILDDATKVKYAIFQGETGENGTPHLQGYVEFLNKQRFATAKTILGLERLHLEPRNGSRDQAREYCRKDDTLTTAVSERLEFGIWGKETHTSELGHLLTELKNGSTVAEVADKYPATWVRNYRGISAFHGMVVSKGLETNTVRGYWIYGDPGIGKTHYARNKLADFPTDRVFMKEQNKWWDGYDGEELVVLDDLDSPVFFHLLKKWGDKYAITNAEIKGGSVKLQHVKFIVTSNYLPEEIFKDPGDRSTDINPTLEAIYRRFRLVEPRSTARTPAGHCAEWKTCHCPTWETTCRSQGFCSCTNPIPRLIRLPPPLPTTAPETTPEEESLGSQDTDEEEEIESEHTNESSDEEEEFTDEEN